jgi:hypothetical protein
MTSQLSEYVVYNLFKSHKKATYRIDGFFVWLFMQENNRNIPPLLH